MYESLYDYPEIYDIYYEDKAYEAETEFIIEHIESVCRSPERVLVVGCGTGNHLGGLLEQGYEVVAVDESEPMLERASEKFPEATFYNTSFPQLGVDGQFDAVLFPYYVINYIPKADIPEGLGELDELLADDGVIVFDWPESKASREFELTVRRTEEGDYCFLTGINPRSGTEEQYIHVVLTDSEGESRDKGVSFRVLETRIHHHEYLVSDLRELDFTCELYDGYGTGGWLDDDIVVCVASRTCADST